MRLILVRHGETQWNSEGKLQGGNSDIPLNEAGIEQARRAAKRLSKEKFVKIYSSPMQRAKHTAEIINEHHGHDIVEHPHLIERRYGKFEGTPYVDFHERMRQVYRENLYEELEIERIDIFENRIRIIVDQLLRHDGDVLVVSHSSSIKMMLSVIQGVNIEEVRKNIKKKNASISIIEFDEDRKVKDMTIGDDTHLV